MHDDTETIEIVVYCIIKVSVRQRDETFPIKFPEHSPIIHSFFTPGEIKFNLSTDRTVHSSEIIPAVMLARPRIYLCFNASRMKVNKKCIPIIMCEA